MRLEVAGIEDYDELLEMLIQAKQQMNKNQIIQWNEYYPNGKIIKEDIKRNELFVLKNEASIIVAMGTFTKIPLEGKQQNFSEDAWFIKRLITKLGYTGKGYGLEWVKQIMNLQMKDSDFLYSCTNHTNLPMQKVFEKAGFEKVDTCMMIDRQEMGDFYLYSRKVG